MEAGAMQKGGVADQGAVVATPSVRMLAYGSNQGIYQVIGTALTFVASIPAAIAMLKRSDERALVRVRAEPGQTS